jgi:hypothetical protein
VLGHDIALDFLNSLPRRVCMDATAAAIAAER